MDVLGEKSIKSLSILTDSFAATEDKMRKAGKLIDNEVIAKYKELDKLDKEISVGDALVGGPLAKGKLVSAFKEAWVEFKSGLQTMTIGIGLVTDATGLSKGAGDRIANQVLDTQTRLALNGAYGSGVGSISPTEYDEIRNKTLNEQQNRQEQLRRIEEVRSENTKKNLTDQEKLNSLYKEQQTLMTRMQKNENDKSKKTQFLDDMEQYLRMIPKVNELSEKVDKKAEEDLKKQQEKDKPVKEYMENVKKDMFSNYSMTDNLTSTGNFLGTARSRLEDITIQQTDILKSIDSQLRDFLQANQGSTVEDFPAL